MKQGNFVLYNFLTDSNLIDKHPEIFKSGLTEQSNQFLKKFEIYTTQLNKINDINAFIGELKNEYNAPDQQLQKKMICGCSRIIILVRN